MTSDSVPLPAWSEVQQRLDAAQKRQDEQRKEMSRINWLRGGGASMMCIGFIAGVVLVAATVSNREADEIRHFVNPYATILTIGGLIVLGIGVILAAVRRCFEAIMARLSRIERRQGAENQLGLPRPRSESPVPSLRGESDDASDYRNHDDREPVDPRYLADMSEAVRIGEELAMRKLQPPDQTAN